MGLLHRVHPTVLVVCFAVDATTGAAPTGSTATTRAAYPVIVAPRGTQVRWSRAAWQHQPHLPPPPQRQQEQHVVVVGDKSHPGIQQGFLATSEKVWPTLSSAFGDNDDDGDSLATATTTIAATTLRDQLAAFPQEQGTRPPNSVFGAPPKRLPPLVLPLLSGIVTFSALQLYFDRPRGRLEVPSTALVVRPSTIGSNAGLGLFVTQDLPQDTVLGTYPGVLRRATSWSAVQKVSQYPRSLVYHFEFTDQQGWYVDPTNERGELENVVAGFGGIGGVSTVLARINEPPLGGPGCNVCCREDVKRREIVFQTSRDVVAGEELFMDYGPKYDRSRYVQKQQGEQETK